MTELTARELLIMLYQTALDAVDGRYLVNQWYQQQQHRQQDRQQHSNQSVEPTVFTHCIAIGKAAAAMLQGALDNSPTINKSLLICPPSKITRQIKKNKNIICQPSTHPIPDALSIDAGQALINFLSETDENAKLLFLISGGASSLVEVLVDDITIDQLQEINQYLLASGKDIHQINTWRQQFSQIKGGGLLNWVKPGAVTQLLLSDVKDDKVEFIGSGLLIENTGQNKIQPEVDDFLLKYCVSNKTRERTINKCIDVDTHIVGNIKLAMQAVYDAAESEGLDSFLYEEFIEGDVAEVAQDLYLILKDAKPGVHIWGGETTVCLPEKPGIGGRNQSLALNFAKNLKDEPGLHLLAAGTDGVDGNSNCAGAVVSTYTLKKAEKMGFDVDQELLNANAGIVLMATDDLVKAENSRTNVMDIIIAYKV